MRVSLVVAACLAPLTAVAVSTPTKNFVAGECVQGWTPPTSTGGAIDLFPFKSLSGNQFKNTVSADYSLLWRIEYHNTYKIIYSKADDKKTSVPVAVLYQCGTDKPQLGSTFENVTVWSVPVQRAAVTSTTYIPFFELIGERQSMVAYTSNMSYVSSPCLKKMHSNGQFAQAWNPATFSVDKAKLDQLGVDLTIADQWSANGIPTAFVMTDTHEPFTRANSTVLQQAEYVEVVAAFFNREKEARVVIDRIVDRYLCTQLEVKKLLSSRKLTTTLVLWANWVADSNGGGWDVGRGCPNYYCEVVQAAGGELVDFTGVKGKATVFGIKDVYLTTAQLVAVAGSASVWIHAGFDNWEVSSKAFKLADVAAIKAVKDGRVFDTHGRGRTDWLESRVAEPDVFLRDVAAALHPTLFEAGGTVRSAVKHTRVWLRLAGVDAVGSTGSPSTCTDTTATLSLTGSDCVPLLNTATAVSAHQLVFICALLSVFVSF